MHGFCFQKTYKVSWVSDKWRSKRKSTCKCPSAWNRSWPLSQAREAPASTNSLLTYLLVRRHPRRSRYLQRAQRMSWASATCWEQCLLCWHADQAETALRRHPHPPRHAGSRRNEANLVSDVSVTKVTHVQKVTNTYEGVPKYERYSKIVTDAMKSAFQIVTYVCFLQSPMSRQKRKST